MTVAIILIILVCAFEFVNGFHDTANAVATVIYTKTLKPQTAVIYSAVMNFLGMLITTSIGYGVSQKIFDLMPWNSIHTVAESGVALIIIITLTSLLWNMITWWGKIPSSSTHALITSLVGASAALSYHQGSHLSIFTDHVVEVIISLLISPLIGVIAGYGLYHLLKHIINDKSIFHKPQHNQESSRISALLISTCGFVSFTHGSNDGQKGLGILMVVLTVTHITTMTNNTMPSIPLWAMVLIPTVLGIGTMIGRKRIVKTIGKKIGSDDMTYAQGAAAELVAASTIGIASASGLPVSTTHVLSSAVMGTMIKHNIEKSINWDTVRNIAMARILTVPVCFIIGYSAMFIWLKTTS